MQLKTIVQPTEVITLEEAREHLRIDVSGSPATHPDDDYITALIAVAREYAENYQQRSIGMVTYRLTRTGWFSVLTLPNPEIIAVDSIKYDDADGNEQTLSASTGYWLTDGKVVMREFPTLESAPDNVRIEYQAGYDTVSSPADIVPNNTIQAMKLVIGEFYENRETVSDKQNYELPLATQTLLTQHRIEMGV